MTKVSINEINENRAYPNSNDSTNGNCEVTHEQNPPPPPRNSFDKYIFASTEAYRSLLLLCNNLYIAILFIVLSKYKLLCCFIYENIMHCIEVG